MVTTAVFVFLCICMIAADDKQQSTNKIDRHFKSEKLQKLLQSYDRVVKPDGPVTVNVTMYISEAIWKENEATFYMYLRQSWNDPRLAKTEEIMTFNAEDIIPHIWKPDTFFPNGIHKSTLEQGFWRIINANALWSQRLKLKVPCIAHYDTLAMNDGKINCTIELESYGFSEAGIKYQWSDRGNLAAFTADKNVCSPITGLQTKSDTTQLTTGNYSRLSANIEMQTPFRKEVLQFLTSRLLKEEL